MKCPVDGAELANAVGGEAGAEQGDFGQQQAENGEHNRPARAANIQSSIRHTCRPRRWRRNP